MKGVPDSGGVWAPCLSYDDGIFYLVYSNVRTFDGPFKDTPNYVVTTKDIRGDWSEPIFLGSSGFDGSLFHGEDGKKHFVSMIVDHREGKFFGGIIIQEYNAKVGQLVGEQKLICEGSEIGKTEAPHIFKRNGFYYLLLAEGGTEYDHAVSIARSENLLGPYEFHPDNPIITASEHPDHVMQKNGHGDLVQAPNGDWYCVYLVGRPIPGTKRCILGRETAISQVEWKDDDWLYHVASSKAAPQFIEVPWASGTSGRDILSFREDFDTLFLNKHFQSLRIPVTSDWASLEERPGYLRLYGRESLGSCFYQSLIARRLQHFKADISTCLEFAPNCYQQLAGLVCYYNTYHWHYLYVSSNEQKQKVIRLMSCDRYVSHDYHVEEVILDLDKPIELKANVNHTALQFYHRHADEDWRTIGPVLDMSILSDDYVQDSNNRYRAAFTGSFVGICCQDLTGQKMSADFDWFDYQETL